MSTMRIALLALLAPLLLASGCFEKEGWAPTKDDNKKIQGNVLKTAPAMKFKINAELEDKATYLGLDVDREVIKPGESFKLTHYWRVKKPIPNWKLFVHLIGPNTYVNADHKPVGGLYPVNQWKANQIIRDAHTTTVPADYKADKIAVYVGFWQGKRRMKIKGPQDEEDRVLAATLSVTTK